MVEISGDFVEISGNLVEIFVANMRAFRRVAVGFMRRTTGSSIVAVVGTVCDPPPKGDR